MAGDCVGQRAGSLAAISGTTGPTVYYDGACPLCAREVGFYRRQDRAEQICWIDISRIDAVDIAPGLTRKQALARLTVRDIDGNFVSGGKGFTKIWKHLPRFRWLAAIFERQPFIWVLEQAYAAFLRHRPLLQAMAKNRRARSVRE